MKKFTLKVITLSIFSLALFQNVHAQIIKTVSGSSAWLGYMNVFDLSNNYQFGGAWGLPDVKSTINASSVVIQPNFNTYNATDPYWANGAIGNKIMEANTYVQLEGISNQTVTFMGNVTSNTLNNAYTRVAFVKVFAADYSSVLASGSVPLPTSGNFSVNAAVPLAAGLHVQYGFTVKGLNANPTAEAALGSVVINQLFPLPLTLTAFNVQKENEFVKLNWTTQSELNVNSFDIEKSLDGKFFDIVTNIKANNKEFNEYSITDNLFLKLAYYRLKMIDNDGKFTYSKVIRVIKTEENTVRLFPNPATDFVNLISNSTSATLYSISGNAMRTITLKEGLNTIDIHTLSIGTYNMKFSNGEVVSFSKK